MGFWTARQRPSGCWDSMSARRWLPAWPGDLRRLIHQPYAETFPESCQGLLDAGQLGRMAGIEEPADLLFITAQADRKLGFGDSGLLKGQIESSLRGRLHRNRNDWTIGGWRGLWDRLTAADPSRDGFLQGVGCFGKGLRHRLSLRNGFGEILERDDEASVVAVRRQGHGVGELMGHDRLLLPPLKLWARCAAGTSSTPAAPGPRGRARRGVRAGSP